MKETAKRLIEKVMNLETGEYLYSDKFFRQPIDEISFFRSELDKAIQKKRTKLFQCPFCKQFVRIRGGLPKIGQEKRMAFHFAHLADTEESN